jgi:hypothetical protein
MVQINHLLPTISSRCLYPSRPNPAVASAAIEIVLLHNPMQTEQIPVLCLHHMFLNPPASIVPKLAKIHKSVSISDLGDDAFFFARLVDGGMAFWRESVEERAGLVVAELDNGRWKGEGYDPEETLEGEE